jgi:hypothetical protein
VGFSFLGTGNSGTEWSLLIGQAEKRDSGQPTNLLEARGRTNRDEKNLHGPTIYEQKDLETGRGFTSCCAKYSCAG